MSAKPRLAFVSTLFLFPADAGGKIRTAGILEGMKGGAFDITLISPATAAQQSQWAARVARVCDRFVAWEPRASRPRWMRALDLLGELPVNVAADRSAAAIEKVRQELAQGDYDIVVFDFVHAAVLKPARLDAGTVCFTHNVEAEILARHAEQAQSVVMRCIWAVQAAKMERFEREALKGFTQVVAVSERDACHFRMRCGIESTTAIPTGVDLDHFAWQAPPVVDDSHPPTVVFTGSMDWDANVDGVRFFIEEVWPRVLAAEPRARFKVVGRNPPPRLVEQGGRSAGVSFTGYVDDVRPHVQSAHVFAIPLRVGGGTRIKAFEAMAMGCPVVSTSIGMEGLDVADDEHYLRRDDPADQAAAIVEMLRSGEARLALSSRARLCVEERFGQRVAARAFEQACQQAMMHWQSSRLGVVPVAC